MLSETAQGSVMTRVGSALVRNVVFPLWARRDHPHYFRYFNEFQQSQFYSSKQIRALQLHRLRALLEHAYQNCPLYRSRMNEAGLLPASVESLESIARLPVLTKRDIQDHSLLMLAGNIPENARVRNQTGGSTGSPLQFYVDKTRLDSRMASTDRHNRWTGLRPGDWHAYLWGARLDQVIHQGIKDWARNTLLYRRIELNTSHITPQRWRELVEKIRVERPRFMIAYAKSAVLLANYIRENNIRDLRFDSIVTTAEVLFPEDRQMLESTFGGRVFNRYGCREVSIIASECEHRRMHVNAEALLVEIMHDETSRVGKVLVTDLLNYSMPLIRYEIGDVAEWAGEQSCPCGRGLSILENVQGRTTDFLELRDGTRVSGPALTLAVADMADVRQVQFVQYGLNDITMRVVPGRGYGEHTQNELRKRMAPYLGGLANLKIEETTGISSEASGKYRFVISHAADELAAAPSQKI